MENNMENKQNEPVMEVQAAPSELSTSTFEYDGFIYEMPMLPKEPLVTFNRMEMAFSTTTGFACAVLTDHTHEFVSLRSDDKYSFFTTLKETERLSDEESEERPHILLYRKEERTPVVNDILFALPDYYESETPELHLPAGEYFGVLCGVLPGENCNTGLEKVGEMYLYPFLIKEHGSRMIHPILYHREREQGSKLELRPTSGRLSLSDEYRYICYNSAYRHVDHSTCDATDNRLIIELSNESIVLDDNYMVVLYHNNEPFMVYRYELLNNEVRHLTATPIDKTSPFYVLATSIEMWISDYKFALELGFTPVKDYILEVLAGTREKGNLMVFSPNLPSEDFLDSIAKLLYDEYDYTMIDGAELAQGWRTSGSRGLKRTFHKERIFVLHNLSILLHPDYQSLLTELDTLIASEDKTFYLFGPTDILSALLKRLFQSADTFAADRRLVIPDYSPLDKVYIVKYHLMNEYMYTLHHTTLKALHELILQEAEIFSPMGISELHEWADNQIVPYLNNLDESETEEDDVDFKVVNIDFDAISLPVNPKEAFQVCMEELNAMVGLDELKSRLSTLFNRMRFDQMRKNMGLPELNDNRLHMIFTGNPGTGKTTVARIMGKIFKELGVLSEGEVITAERADMVGKYIGHTEDTMKELIERAKGNVLFIDEAYSLGDGNRGDRTDYGYRAIECLLGVLANNDSDLIVIMAGYEKEMKQLLESNPGLRGRFAYTFHFEDFTEEQLLEICLNKLDEKQFQVEKSVKNTILECIQHTLAVKDELFHNARWAEQFVMQGIVSAMADRLSANNPPANIHDLCRVTDADVLKGYEMTRPAGKVVRRQVGFKRA